MRKLKKLSRNDLKEVKGGQVWIAVTKCGFTATTTQDWTAAEANDWVDEIEKNYCQPATHSGPSNNLA